MENRALELLRAGDLALGVSLRQARNAEAALALETAGFDWLFLDLEHNAMSIETASEIGVAVLARPISAIARVPEGQFGMAARLLDNGLEGIVMPHVNTANEAEEIVRELRYPPVGKRSIGSMQPHVAFADVPVGELTERLQRKTLVAVMLESREAVENCDEIASVDGIDVLMIGGNDLCLDFGVPGQVDHPDVVEAFRCVADACKRHRRFAGLGGVRRVEHLSVYVGMGYRFLFASDDLRLMIAAGRDRVAALRALASR